VSSPLPELSAEAYRPLASVRVLDVGGADSDAVGRLFGDLGDLGDLGDDVLKIEPPRGAADRVARPTVAGTGVAFALRNASKRSALLDAGSAADRGLLIKPNNYIDELTRPSALPGSRAIRRALEFIESRPGEIETVANIANEVGLSVRGLDDGFHRYVGTPPMSYLRHVRVSRAHDDVVSADPALTTATMIARRWGYGHYGRFASEYRRRHGRKPSETLRARRAAASSARSRPHRSEHNVSGGPWAAAHSC
jgi:AraC-like DNA-binding protein